MMRINHFIILLVFLPWLNEAALPKKPFLACDEQMPIVRVCAELGAIGGICASMKHLLVHHWNDLITAYLSEKEGEFKSTLIETGLCSLGCLVMLKIGYALLVDTFYNCGWRFNIQTQQEAKNKWQKFLKLVNSPLTQLTMGILILGCATASFKMHNFHAFFFDTENPYCCRTSLAVLLACLATQGISSTTHGLRRLFA
jgi:hypothetical protein